MLTRTLNLRLSAIRTQFFATRGFHGASALFSYPKDKNGVPLGPYMRFCSEERPKVKASNKDLKTTEVAKELGRLWRNLPENEKLRYKQEYADLVKKD